MMQRGRRRARTVDPLSNPILRTVAVAWAVLAGAAIGSFLNVVVARVPHGQSVVRPRSRCPRCGAPIAWYDNVPIVSWLVLRARCRSCGAPISFRYPLLEALGAAAGAAAVLRHGLALAALAEFAFVALLLALAFIDLDTWLLPHALTWPAIALGLAAAAIGAGAAPSFRSAAIGAAAGWAAFALVAFAGERLLRREALGFGDVWLLAGIGAFLGVAALLPVVLLASIQGSVVGLVQLALGRGEPGPGAAGDGAAAPPSTPAAEPSSNPAVERDPARAAPPEPAPETDEDWVPPRHAVPFGPFLALGALEWLYAARVLARAVPGLRAFL